MWVDLEVGTPGIKLANVEDELPGRMRAIYVLQGLALFNIIVLVRQRCSAPLDAWQVRHPFPAPSRITLNAVSYGNGLWVAVGWRTIATSPDGVQWTVRSAGTAYNLSGIGYGDGVWLAVGSEDLSFSLFTGIRLVCP